MRVATPASPGARAARVPPGWPTIVPPPGVTDWQVPAIAWLLDQCPPDYRLYAAWRRHPVALAWLTLRHLEGQIAASRAAYRCLRVDLADQVSPQALADILEVLAVEGVRLLGVQRSAGLLFDALEGREFVPRL